MISDTTLKTQRAAIATPSRQNSENNSVIELTKVAPTADHQDMDSRGSRGSSRYPVYQGSRGSGAANGSNMADLFKRSRSQLSGQHLLITTMMF
jgi:hypothetical protein